VARAHRFRRIAPAHESSPTRIGFEAAAYSLLGPVLRREQARASRILDVGCSTAEYRFWFTAANYVGVDVENRDFAAKTTPGVALFPADAQALPLADEAVDLVLCAYALDRFPDAAAALAEMSRVLRPGGLVLLALPTPAVRVFDLPLALARCFGLLRNVEMSGQTNVGYFTPRRLGSLAESAGFATARLLHVGGPFTFAFKTCWLWFRFLGYVGSRALLRLRERFRGRPFKSSVRKRLTIFMLPRRASKHARDAGEFAESTAQAAGERSMLGLAYELAAWVCLTLDARLFPARGSEFVALLRKRT
jgi:SAM-dependent methyltransferase